jgi:hypothetical protein
MDGGSARAGARNGQRGGWLYSAAWVCLGVSSPVAADERRGLGRERELAWTAITCDLCGRRRRRCDFERPGCREGTMQRLKECCGSWRAMCDRVCASQADEVAGRVAGAAATRQPTDVQSAATMLRTLRVGSRATERWRWWRKVAPCAMVKASRRSPARIQLQHCLNPRCRTRSRRRHRLRLPKWKQRASASWLWSEAGGHSQASPAASVTNTLSRGGTNLQRRQAADRLARRAV